MGGLGESGRRDVSRQDRMRAVRAHAERTAQDLDLECTDSVLHMARAFGAIDRDEVVAQFEARVGFLERQVERLLGRREQVDRAVHGELQLMRTRVLEALRAVEESAEEDRRARHALEGRVQAMLDASEERSRLAGQALRENLVSAWQRSVESQERAHMDALESELAERAVAVQELVGEIHRTLEAQVAATVRATRALAESAFAGVLDRLPAARVRDADALPVLPAPDAPGAQAG